VALRPLSLAASVPQEHIICSRLDVMQEFLILLLCVVGK
jgi:hypothetical protein